MKKLLTILAISTITIVPSVTLVSCFNETDPKYLTFDKKDPIGSINKAIENRNLKLSAGDFGYKAEGENSEVDSKITNGNVTNSPKSIVYEISNTFTKIEDMKAARTWLNDNLDSDSIENKEIIPGEVFSLHLKDKENKNEETFIKFDVQEGYSFNWLKNSTDEQEDFFIKGATKIDFSKENSSDSIKTLSHLIELFTKYKTDNSDSGKLLRNRAAMEIYSSLVSQSISKVQHESKSGWKIFEQLNSSVVIFNEDNDEKEKMKNFTKGSSASIADFITSVANEKEDDSKLEIESFVGTLVDALDKDKNEVFVNTNFFKFEIASDSVAKDTTGWYKFKITKK